MTSMTKITGPVTGGPVTGGPVTGGPVTGGPVTGGPVTGGVDTHRDVHHVAVIDLVGREVADAAFPATPAGYRQALRWLRSHGILHTVGVEGTGSYGAALARYLRTHDVTVIEVDRPDRKTRRARGKSDPIDAYAAARAALNGTATATPKTRDGHVEAIRALRLARSSAVKARTQAMNQLRALLITAPTELREQLRHLRPTALIDTCARLRPNDAGHAGHDANAVATTATKQALRRLARRHQYLTTEITDANSELAALVTATASQLLTVPGVGVEVAGQLLVTTGDNPHRLHSEAAFAHLCGVAPIPASSGRIQNRHRLNRGGNRAGNHALHTIALTRMRHHQPTRDYVARRTTEGLSKPEIMRCLKRYLARQIYPLLNSPAALDTP